MGATARMLLIVPLIVLLLAAVAGGPARAQEAVPPPRPLLPIPTSRQLDWQRDELRMFVHFGVNTFTDREWGTGEEDPAIFNPSALDAAQWARVAREAGFKTMILTAKHHDGFALWPSDYTTHDVASSPWRAGEGDVVREFVDAAHAEGLKVGLYLSPWDRHEPTYGDEEAYNAFYMGQLRELLTGYGPLHEVWFDGAKGEDAKDMDYDFDAYWAMVRQLQPDAVLFSDAGPDVRWIGNEHGFAGETNWSTYDRSKVGIGMHGIQDYLNTGEAGAPDWVPGECDTSIRPGWFWHADEEPNSLEELLEIYYKSVGRNCVLLLNVPPTDEGLLDVRDVERLREFRAALDEIFDEDLASGARVAASSSRGEGYGAEKVLDGDPDTFWAPGDEEAWLELELGAPVTFNVVRLQEPIAMGQRVAAYRVDVQRDGAWETVIRGTTIGYKKLDRLEEPISTDRVRIVIDNSLALPLLAETGLYLDPHAASQ